MRPYLGSGEEAMALERHEQSRKLDLLIDWLWDWEARKKWEVILEPLTLVLLHAGVTQSGRGMGSLE